jgi:1-acyl-sn-glycerol-3-phosphate acyltransferase
MARRASSAGETASSVGPATPAGASSRPARQPFLRRLVGAILRSYMRAFHNLSMQGRERLPERGPALVLVNHASLLDVPAMMSLDPYPDTATIVKASLFRVPVVGWVLRQWGAVAVERQGRDTAGIRSILEQLRGGRVVAIAAEGRRTRTGRLAPINTVLARIAVSAQVPLIPVGIVGSFEALPPGALFPRRKPILVRVGEPFRLPRGTHGDEAARRIRAEIAALLDPHQRPDDAIDQLDAAAEAGHAGAG